MGKYFGTDGFRGEANRTLTAWQAYRVGRFLGWYYGQEKHCAVVIGKDTRRSSYMLEDALSSGLTSSGADVYLLHVTTTPSVSYVVSTEGFDCGIMISASHNPFYDNGIKLINGRGEKMDQEVIDRIEEYLDSPADDLPLAQREAIGRTVDYAAGRNRYIGYLISLARKSFKGVRVGLDCANGSTWQIAKSVFDALGATTYVIGAEPDGLNINRGVGSTHLEALRSFVLERELDVGFAYDGDADRCLAVDGSGEIIDGDKILYIYGVYMKQRDKLVGNTVVTTVMSNYGLHKAFERAGIDTLQTAVGDKYVYQAMREHGYHLGGEQSGHIIFSKYATTGDGMLTSIKLMEVMLERHKSLSELCADLTVYPQKLVNVRVSDKAAALSDAAVCAAVAESERQLEGAGRVLVRESGTEPLIRVMAEAPEQAACDEAVDRVVCAIREKGYEV